MTWIVLSVPLAPLPAAADWPTFGRALSTAAKNQELPKTTTDGADGAIVVWQAFKNLFATRVLAVTNRSSVVHSGWPSVAANLANVRSLAAPTLMNPSAQRKA